MTPEAINMMIRSFAMSASSAVWHLPIPMVEENDRAIVWEHMMFRRSPTDDAAHRVGNELKRVLLNKPTPNLGAYSISDVCDVAWQLSR